MAAETGESGAAATAAAEQETVPVKEAARQPLRGSAYSIQTLRFSECLLGRLY